MNSARCSKDWNGIHDNVDTIQNLSIHVPIALCQPVFKNMYFLPLSCLRTCSTMKEEGVVTSARSYFTNRVKHNLHIFLVYKSCDQDYRDASLKFPALSTRMYLDRYEELATKVSVCEHARSVNRHLFKVYILFYFIYSILFY